MKIIAASEARKMSDAASDGCAKTLIGVNSIISMKAKEGFRACIIYSVPSAFMDEVLKALNQAGYAVKQQPEAKYNFEITWRKQKYIGSNR